MILDEKRVVTPNGDNYETIMIEISLSEYRSLIEENMVSRIRIERLENENNLLKGGV